MAHYALLDENNIVINVIVGRNEEEVIEGVSDWELYYSQETGYKCLRTSYNTYAGVHYNAETGLASEDQSKAFRGNYASVGFFYDEERDVFIPPKPFDSWVMTDSSSWEAPVEYPTDGKAYLWDEQSVSWIEEQQPS